MSSLRSILLCVLLGSVSVSLAGCPLPPVCGDGACEAGEGPATCAADCGGDPSGYCDSQPTAENASLDMWLLQQWCSQWCWAAVITNVANYYGRTADGYGPVQECQLASYRLGDPSLSVCCQYQACAYQACNSPGSFEQMAQTLTALGITGQLLGRSLSENEIQLEIANGRPIIMAVQSQTSGHVAIITGYGTGPDGQMLYGVDDPWPDYTTYGIPPSDGTGTHYALPYQNLVYGGATGQSVWVATFTRLSPRADGCSPPVNPTCGCD